MRRSYSRLLERIKAACQRHGYEYQAMGFVGSCKQFELPRVIISPKTYEKTVAVVAGVHGDEPAPIEAAVQFLEEGISVESVRVLLYPCLNPWGYVHNKRSNYAGKDLNRTRSLKLEAEQSLFLMSLLNEQLDFFLAMHEDCMSSKMYAFVFGAQYSAFYRAILNGAASYLPFQCNECIGGMEADNGLIVDRQDGSLEDIISRTGIPCMCSETGSRADLQRRINANLEILRKAESVFRINSMG